MVQVKRFQRSVEREFYEQAWQQLAAILPETLVLEKNYEDPAHYLRLICRKKKHWWQLQEKLASVYVFMKEQEIQFNCWSLDDLSIIKSIAEDFETKLPKSYSSYTVVLEHP